jgi:hypothetical protein
LAVLKAFKAQLDLKDCKGRQVCLQQFPGLAETLAQLDLGAATEFQSKAILAKQGKTEFQLKATLANAETMELQLKAIPDSEEKRAALEKLVNQLLAQLDQVDFEEPQATEVSAETPGPLDLLGNLLLDLPAWMEARATPGNAAVQAAQDQQGSQSLDRAGLEDFRAKKETPEAVAALDRLELGRRAVQG